MQWGRCFKHVTFNCIDGGFWGLDALLIATYLQSKQPSKTIANLSPYEHGIKYKPSDSHLKMFGCIALSFRS